MKILLADDHALIRAGLRSELVELGPDVAFVEACDADTLRQAFAAHHDLDLALVDLTMPGMRGAETIGALRAAYPAIPLIVISGADTGTQVRDVLRAGAAGFIPKAAMTKVMLQAIRLVLAGGQYIPPQLMQMLEGSARDPDAGRTATPAETSRLPANPGALKMLSPRQREVFGLLARGLSNKMIARQLDVTEGTVKTHIAAIFAVLNVHNRVSAISEATRASGDADGTP